MKSMKDMKKGNGIPEDVAEGSPSRDFSLVVAALHVFQPFFVLFLFRLLESRLRSGVLTATQRAASIRDRMTTERRRPRFPEQ